MPGAHTFAGFECVGDRGSIGGDLAETGRYDNSCPTHSNVRNEWAPGKSGFGS
jgi:hypothetical protein